MPPSTNHDLDAVRNHFRHLWHQDTTVASPRYRDSSDDVNDTGDRDAELPATPAESYTSEDGLLSPAYTIPKQWTRRRSFSTCGAVWLAMFLIFALLNLVLFVAREVWDDGTDDFEEASAVVPIPCHSHNDYWRKRPVFSALEVGCVGIEADVWLYDEELYVGHNRWSLRKETTFTNLYVNTLVRLLEERNPNPTNALQQRPRGIYEANPDQTLVLLVDLKTNGTETWPRVVSQLEPLRQRGWLSTFVDGKVNYGPITVVGTGNTPFEMIIGNATYRDTFFDAPITNLDSHDFSPANSYYTSASFKKAVGTVWFGNLSDKQVMKMNQQIRQAHSRGLKVRYWDLPAWPISIRNHIWGVLIRNGVDILNVDDLKGARKEWDLRGWPTLGPNTTAAV